MFVTAQTQEYIDLSREVGDALASLGLDVREVDGILTVDGARAALNLVARAHPTPADLRQLAESATGHLPAVVVADRISEPGRDELRRAGWGWLDRRGHVRVWTPGVRILGYRDGANVAQTDWFSDIGAQPKWFAMNLQNVDRIVIESKGEFDNTYERTVNASVDKEGQGAFSSNLARSLAGCPTDCLSCS